jgi:uncharacterized protein YqjF (DUF2071 family)
MPELNVRTYVRYRGQPGVWFFSLDAGSRLAVWAARAAYHLPYFYAAMESTRQGEEIRYLSQRTGGGAVFRGSYGPAGPAQAPQPNSLEHFLVERYCLFALRGRQVLRADIHHPAWELQPAAAKIGENTMAAACGLRLPVTAPLLHYAERQEVLVWWPVAV